MTQLTNGANANLFGLWGLVLFACAVSSGKVHVDVLTASPTLHSLHKPLADPYNHSIASSMGEPSELPENQHRWTVVPPEKLPAFPPISAAQLPPIKTKQASEIQRASRRFINTMMFVLDDEANGFGTRRKLAPWEWTSDPKYVVFRTGFGNDVRNSSREERTTQVIVEVTGYLPPARSSDIGLLRDYGKVGPFALTPDQRVVVLQHTTGAQASLVLRPASFDGWYRSSADLLTTAIPSFSNAAELVFVQAVVPTMVRKMKVANYARNVTYVNTNKERRKMGFGRLLPEDVNIEVEFFNEKPKLRQSARPVGNRAEVDWEGSDDGFPARHKYVLGKGQRLQLTPGTPDSGNITVDQLFEHMILRERRARGAVRWWPGMVLRYQLVREVKPRKYASRAIIHWLSSMSLSYLELSNSDQSPSSKNETAQGEQPSLKSLGL